MLSQIEQLRSFLTALELSPWQWIPSLVLFGLIGLGLIHAFNQRPNRKIRQLKERSERRRIPLPLMISTPVTQEFSVKTFDVSLSGAFLHYEDLKSSMTFTSLLGRRSGIKVGDLIEVRVITGRFSQFQCQARVVRFCLEDDNTPFPRGLGIEFLNLNSRKIRSLAALIYKDQWPHSA